MRHVAAGLLTLLVIALMAYTAMQGGAYHGGEGGKIIADIGQNAQMVAEPARAQQTQELSEEDRQLKALKEKAVGSRLFETSAAFSRKCSSCHGNNGEGIIGPKLIGLSADDAFTKLMDYKAGRKPNAVMKGLLLGMDEEEIRTFANEIGGFAAKSEAAQ